MPSGGALFGSTAAGPGSTGGNKHLVEVRAGKMNLKARMVHPDKRKGLLYVYQSDDSLMHFCWQDRTTGIVEDDLIIFPDDCEYVKVPQCTTGRTYLLKFKSSNRKFFFWLQEPRTDKDDDNCKRINELLNNPSSVVQSSHSPDQDLQSLLSNMSQSQLMQLFGSGGGIGPGLSSILGTVRGPNSGTSTGSARTSSTPAITHRPTAASATVTPPTGASPKTPQNAPIPVATPEAPQKAPAAAVLATPTPAPQNTASEKPGTAGGQKIELSDFQNFLQSFMQTQGGSGGQSERQSVDLSTVLTNDALTGILSKPEALQSLESHLPTVDSSNGSAQEALKSTLASPQFQQAVSQFSSALESGQLGPVVSQLEVNSEAVAAASHGNMQAFVKALEKTTSGGESKPKDKKDGKKSDKKKEDDEHMQLD